MRKTLATVSLLTLLRCVSGCIGPYTTDDNLDCAPVTNSRIIDSDERQSFLEVTQGFDAVGRPYQLAHFTLATPRAPGVVQMVLNLNGQRQATVTWNGRLVGLGQPENATGMEPGFMCENTDYWRVPVGFGTIAEERHGSRDPAFSQVGRPLRDGQEIQVRIDICIGSNCTFGIPRTFRVRLRP